MRRSSRLSMRRFVRRGSGPHDDGEICAPTTVNPNLGRWSCSRAFRRDSWTACRRTTRTQSWRLSARCGRSSQRARPVQIVAPTSTTHARADRTQFSIETSSQAGTSLLPSHSVGDLDYAAVHENSTFSGSHGPATITTCSERSPVSGGLWLCTVAPSIAARFPFRSILSAPSVGVMTMASMSNPCLNIPEQG